MKKVLVSAITAGVVVSALGFAMAQAISGQFQLNTKDLLTRENASNNIAGKFANEYQLTYAVADENAALTEEISALAKKTTFLLFGEPNREGESVEQFYQRKKDFYALRYAPEIPKSDKGTFGLDEDSQEYRDDLVSGMAIPQIFSKANEIGMKYNSYGDIRVTKNNEIVIAMVSLPGVKIKEESKSDPMRYEYVDTNFVMYYYYKKLGNEWKLYYLYGESTDDVQDYFGEIESTDTTKSMAVAPTYQSKLSTVYNFDKLTKLPQSALDKVYRENSPKTVFLESYYNNMVVNSGNGFFIGNGLVVTTWSVLEKALTDAQYILARDASAKNLEVEGVVTVNPEADIAVLKVKSGEASVKLGEKSSVAVEDPVIMLSSKIGLGALVQTGIVVSSDGYLQTSIPLSDGDAGSALFNQNGEVVGMNTAKATESSVSLAVNVDALKEVQAKFSGKNADEISVVSFDDLKQDYYKKRTAESVQANIPENVWREYAKVGNIQETIQIEPTKSSFKDGIVSLRYKNHLAPQISSLDLAGEFREQLKKDGYKEIMLTPAKAAYENKQYRVIILDEFGYLIIVIARK